MRGATDTSERDPMRRLLAGVAGALRARRHLPTRDPRRSSSRWLRPNWPDELLLTVHRSRLISALATDESLRQEVRNKLGISALGDLPGSASDTHSPSETRDLLAAVVAAADDPVAVVESAATHEDPDVARAAAPYLRREIPLPARVPRQPSPGHQTAGGGQAEHTERWHRRAREAEKLTKSLRRECQDQRSEILDLQQQLKSAVERADNAESQVKDLRQQLPSRREREALAAASSHQDKIDDLKRSLDRERAERRAQVRELRGLVSDSEAELAHAQEERDAEARGRRRLEADLGDDASRRASRLVPLVERERADLRERAARLPDGLEKTRAHKRSRKLGELASSLKELYGLDKTGDSRPAAAGGQDGRAAESAVLADIRSRGLTVRPIGGANHIGGSSILVEAGGTRVLVDAGLKPQAHVSHPGPDHIEEAVRDHIDAIVITHAHADHAGFVPWVVERHRRTQVLCTPQTKALLPVVWADSVRVMRADADASSHHGDHVEPPYGEAEVEQAENRLMAVRHGQTVAVGDLEITLFPAGHILGAAGVVVRAGDQRVVITGDIDNRRQASVSPAQLPSTLARNADLLVIETTYCDRLHGDRAQEGSKLVRQAEEVLSAGGRILVPAFGLGRAQEVALLLAEQLPDVDVLVDGIARDISDLYGRNGAPEVLTGRVRKVKHRHREIAGFREGIVITTSGMLTGGAAIPWAQAVLAEPDSALFLCGHQDEEAPGRQLQELADAAPDGPRKIHLRDDRGRAVAIDVAASVGIYNLSAHADQAGLKSIVDEVHPGAVMMVHGESGPQAMFRARLAGAGYAVTGNQGPWDTETVVADTRLARTRHLARGRGHR